ncbi:member of the syntaxin family of t-SNARE [Trypanosoma theileri]|uniref:Member of the syntaxin family of t-SNARE n=1 Tax=Trypanosoma theileri TaxID=67003 RepID=A0A1X0NXH2_9TRYP|nr:member of the syntaxin family of t-SNARE [Trypanosoma theileri]ORC89396.1 member of the syntaxin family of t-SNARE [Trypanosoma theileri]
MSRQQPSPQQQQQQTQPWDHITEQNKLLDQLHSSVMNTRHYAVSIGNDLREQEGMLDELHSGVTLAADESRRQNSNVVRLLKESENRGFCTAVIVLVAIMILLIMI